MPKSETVTLEIPDGLLEIIDHFANTLGISREEATLHFIRNDAMDWYAVIMNAKRKKNQ